MQPTLMRLYPPQATEVPLRGLYLAHRLHELGTAQEPFIYANFVASLDGRIALRDPATGTSEVPRALTSRNDLRLLLELHAQADCLVTNAGYLRAIAAGQLDDLLQVGTVAGHEDLAQWRVANGLPPQPTVCVASASLAFSLPPSVERFGQAVFVATGARAAGDRVRALEARGCEVVVAGDADVEGAPLARALADRGCKSAFLLAGPRMLDATLRAGVLSRLYLTLRHVLLGGEHFHALLEGAVMGGQGELKLRALYLDAPEREGPDQLFAHYEPLRRSA